MNFFTAIFHNPFLQNALIAGLLAALPSGVTGSFVVAKKISSITGSIAHSVLGGIGLALFLDYKKILTVQPLYGALLFAVIAAFTIGYFHLKHRQNEDAVIATVWSAGMAIGVILASLIKSFNVDFSGFLFGNILWTNLHDLYLLAILDLVIIGLVTIFYYRFLAVAFDEEQAKLQGLPVHKYYFLLLTTISLSIVLLIQIIGIILVITLLTIPPSIARIFTASLPKMMLAATIFAILLNFFGTMIAYECNTAPGATISLTAVILYPLAFFIKKITERPKKAPDNTLDF